MGTQTDIRPNDRRRKLEMRLDEALAQTFPASDPFSVCRFTGTEPPSRPVDRLAPEVVAPQTKTPERRRKTASRRVAG